MDDVGLGGIFIPRFPFIRPQAAIVRRRTARFKRNGPSCRDSHRIDRRVYSSVPSAVDWQAFLCIHEGLFYFRINSLGAWILGFSSEFVPPIEEAQPVLRVPPNTVADLFREARSRVGRIVIRNSARIYGCECPALAKLVTNDSRLHGLCHLAENRLAVVPSDSVQRFREALGRLGYAAPSVSANPSPG